MGMMEMDLVLGLFSFYSGDKNLEKDPVVIKIDWNIENDA
jgi:hypothetical protein